MILRIGLLQKFVKYSAFNSYLFRDIRQTYYDFIIAYNIFRTDPYGLLKWGCEILAILKNGCANAAKKMPIWRANLGV